ncbi:hypothetical protein BCR34DRAFT_589220 [Clohesyomyces aquaticus]|uniref:Uncharacterized protein n=1 Tax=Clohesyomyces aquaticus TaxID=1231657 RepID=A0A1Y1ZH87_9PLEO|nr:hypothetical protein BCR34DRAFT_589220 [Clohesyomyces aquaticus]
MADQSRVLKVVQQEPDLTALVENKFNLHVAKSLVKDGKPIFNVMWQSRTLAQTMTIEWKTVYGLNWTTDVPTPGHPVTLAGSWKQCDRGQVIDLDETGQWVQSTSSPSPDHLMVGKNRLRAPAPKGVHIVVGVQAKPGNFDPIFVDNIRLGVGMSAKYQPQEQVQWWYQSDMRSSAVVEGVSTVVETGDYSAKDPVSGTYKKTSSYSYDTGAWVTTSP